MSMLKTSWEIPEVTMTMSMRNQPSSAWPKLGQDRGIMSAPSVQHAASFSCSGSSELLVFWTLWTSRMQNPVSFLYFGSHELLV